MGTEEKRTLSARKLLSDIREGMDRRQLKEKYGLSDRALQSALGKLVTAGACTEQEMQMRGLSAPALHDAPHKDSPTTPVQKCPACDAALASDNQECPACGVVVAKFEQLRERKILAPSADPVSNSEARNLVLYISCILVAALLVGGYLFFVSKDSKQEKSEAIAESDKQQPTGTTSMEAGSASRAPAQAKRIEKESPNVPNIFAMNLGKLLELRFVPDGFPLGLSVSQGSGGIHFFETPDSNQGFKHFPPETGAKRYYDQFTIGGQAFLMITEGSNPSKIYLDTNRNGDMTDDPGPFAGEGPNPAPNHYTLELPYEGEDKPLPYRLWLFPSRMGGIRFYSKCYWEGQMEVNGTMYKLVTFDGNADGDYSNDPVIIDTDNDGKAGDSERLKAGQRISVEGIEVKLLAVAPSGRWIRIQY